MKLNPNPFASEKMASKSEAFGATRPEGKVFHVRPALFVQELIRKRKSRRWTAFCGSGRE